MVSERICFANYEDNEKLQELEIRYRISTAQTDDVEDENLDIVLLCVLNGDMDILPQLNKQDIDELIDVCREDYFSGDWEYAEE
jgi:hypothetical protein